MKLRQLLVKFLVTHRAKKNPHTSRCEDSNVLVYAVLRFVNRGNANFRL
jgi:hypothetical protein